MALVDVKRTKADKKAEADRWKEPEQGEDYPYGLQLRLDNATIQKLGLGDMDAEETVRIHAEAFVSEDSANMRNGKTDRAMTLQVTKLAVVQGESDDVKASEMYDKKG